MLFFVFLFVFSFSLFNIFSIIDYYALKFENAMLKYKLVKIIKDAEEGMSYIHALKNADRQLADISFKQPQAYSQNLGGPTSLEFFRFAKIINNIDYSKISEKEISDYYTRIKDEAQKRIADYEKLFSYITSKISKINSTPKGWPTPGYVSSSFGYRIHPFTLSYDFHSGIDIVNEPGSDIKATADGVVRYTGWAMGYGLCVIIDHGFGYTTLYGHLSQVNVKEGDIIKRGTIIGKLGSTGTSTGPHLHYEVWEYGVPKNPIKYINP